MSAGNQRHFEVRKDNLERTRITDAPLPELDDGEVLVGVDAFALTANNITYGVVAERIGYWRFFPAPEGWGRIPVWGFGDVVASAHPDLPVGERLYGYFPMSTHLTLRPGRFTGTGLHDASEHRAGLPAVYNAYARTAGETWYDPSMDEERMLLFPLYATSFCIADFLDDKDVYGAEQVLILSASSRTAIGLAYALETALPDLRRIGLTSRRNRERVAGLDLYDTVVTYDRLDDIDTGQATVIVDMSGDGELVSALHTRLGDNMRYTANVGITHHDAGEAGPGVIRERSEVFFAPAHIEKRTRDWGPGEFQKRAFAFWADAAVRSREWLTIERVEGIETWNEVYQAVRDGRAAPDRGFILSP